MACLAPGEGASPLLRTTRTGGAHHVAWPVYSFSWLLTYYILHIDDAGVGWQLHSLHIGYSMCLGEAWLQGHYWQALAMRSSCCDPSYCKTFTAIGAYVHAAFGGTGTTRCLRGSPSRQGWHVARGLTHSLVWPPQATCETQDASTQCSVRYHLTYALPIPNRVQHGTASLSELQSGQYANVVQTVGATN